MLPLTPLGQVLCLSWALVSFPAKQRRPDRHLRLLLTAASVVYIMLWVGLVRICSEKNKGQKSIKQSWRRPRTALKFPFSYGYWIIYMSNNLLRLLKCL